MLRGVEAGGSKWGALAATGKSTLSRPPLLIHGDARKPRKHVMPLVICSGDADLRVGLDMVPPGERKGSRWVRMVTR